MHYRPRFGLGCIALTVVMCWIWFASILLLATVASAQTQANDPVAGSTSVGSTSGGVLSRRDLAKRLGQARALVADKQFSEALAHIQKVLDNPRDEYGPSATAPNSWISAKTSAEALLASLPDEAQQIYEKQYGPIAARLLAESHESLEKIATVSDRYSETEAGIRAQYLLSVRYGELGHPQLALIGYENLARNQRAARILEPQLSIRHALTLAEVGKFTQAALILREIRPQLLNGSVVIAGRPQKLPGDLDLEQWLTEWRPNRLQDPLVTQSGWLTWRGNPERNGSGTGGGPYLNHGWNVDNLADVSPNTNDGMAIRILAELTQLALPEKESLPCISPAAPLVLGDRVIVRSLFDLRAIHRKTGEILWKTTERDKELQELLRPGALPQSNQTSGSAAEHLVSQRMFNDVTFHALSSDGDRVFAVEDLGILGVRVGSRINPTSSLRSRLVAYDAQSGKLIWEAGGGMPSETDPLSGAAFLGPPLCWQGLLYSIVDVGGSPVLAVHEPHNGSLLRIQPLRSDDPQVDNFDNSRLHSGLTPSIADGILVCPTGPESVTAYDPGRRRLLWHTRFRPIQEEVNPRLQRLLAQQSAARNTSRLPEQSGWLDYAGVVESGKIVYTPRDHDELLCLNTADGTLAWTKPREDGIYVAGVSKGIVLVVGRSFVRGHRLDDGQLVWSTATLLPPISGRACLTDQQLLVPLTTAEVATLDVESGKILARARSFLGRVPGSLVVANGSIISQRFESVSGFRQVADLQEEIQVRLADNPKDAQSLTIRGQMRLEQQQFAEAIEDLEQAISVDSKLPEARTLLLAGLLEGLRTDFGKYRVFGERVKSLIESDRDRTEFNWLMAQGDDRLGNRSEAFMQLLELVAIPYQERELDRIQAAQRVHRDRLISMMISRILEQAPSDDQVRFQSEIDRVARAILMQQSPAQSQRMFNILARVLPNHQALVIDSAKSLSTDRWLAAELQIARALDRSPDEFRPALYAEWGELIKTADIPRDLRIMSTLLSMQPMDARLNRGDTVAERLTQWQPIVSQNRRPMPLEQWPISGIQAERQQGVRPVSFGRSHPIAIEGPRGPFMTGVNLELTTGDLNVIARDSQGRSLWKLAIEVPVWGGNAQSNRAYVRGHLVILLIGKDLYAIDLLGAPSEPGPRWLWHVNMIEGSAAIPVLRGLNSSRNTIAFAPLGPENTALLGPITLETVTVLKGRRLLALDLVTGKPVWTRDGIPAGSGLIGNDDRLVVFAPESHEGRIFDMRDGTELRSQRLPPSSWWIGGYRGNLLLWGKPIDRQVLALRDLFSDTDIWSHQFEPGAHVAIADGEAALVLEPTGRVTCIALATGEIRFQTQVERREETNRLQVVTSGDQYLLVANQPLAVGQTIVQHSQNVHIEVNGLVHALNISDGKLLWTTPVERQQFDPQQPSAIPLLTFASHVFEPRQKGNGLEQRFLLTTIDRRTGKVLYDDSRNDEPLHFIEYEIDEDTPSIELKLFQSVLRFTFGGKPSKSE